MREVPSTKKPYRRPRLRAYGGLRELTRSGAQMGKKDNPLRPVKDMSF
jgi:hypothetical protein